MLEKLTRMQDIEISLDLLGYRAMTVRVSHEISQKRLLPLYKKVKGFHLDLVLLKGPPKELSDYF